MPGPKYSAETKDRFFDSLDRGGTIRLSMAMLKSPLVAMRSPHSSACVQAVVGVVRAPLVRACFMR